jgi:hypothetical protein
MFDVRLFGEEQLNLVSRPDLMEQLSKTSGGAVLRDDDAGELTAKFREHQQRARAVRVIRATAWDRWWALLIVFGCWCLSWALRRSSGLI